METMTQDKELLLKDISARLPYGVKCVVTKSRTEEGQKGDVGEIVCVCLEGVDCIDTSNFFSEFGNFKPYLFPLSSMSEEQKTELMELMYKADTPFGAIFSENIDYFDWLNKHHFDYRGLIEKGLALDATGKGIY